MALNVQKPVSMLDPVYHQRLLADIDGICLAAGVPKAYLHQSASATCGPNELQWLIRFREMGHPGLRLTGPRPVERCMALGAALLRNYVDARVKTLDELIDQDLECTVVICPNFQTAGQKLPDWRTARLYDQLVGRFRSSRPTVLWSETQDVRGYGQPMSDLLSNYMMSKA